MADVFCNNCGHKNPLGANFCSSCGTPLERDPEDPTTITFQIDGGGEVAESDLSFDLDDIPPDGGLLVVVRGPNAGARLALVRDVTTAGRHPEADLFLDDVTVSRRHAEFARPGRRLPHPRRRQPERHLPQRRAGRRRRRSPTATRSRSAVTSWRSTPDDDVSDTPTEAPDRTSRSARCCRCSSREFPDVTISKIRFLESQGLLDPERTPSGYRKFYDGDLERLRWILTQQRDHFLPLKVIKERLAEDPGPHRRPLRPPAIRTPRRPRCRPSRCRPPRPRRARRCRGSTGRRWPRRSSAGPPCGPRPASPAPDRCSTPGPRDASFSTAELAAAAGIADRDIERLGVLRA